MAASCLDVTSSRRRLARIRCLSECVDCLRNNKPFPLPLCYIPESIEYKTSKTTKLTLYDKPSTESNKLREIFLGKGDRFFVSGEELCNSQGQWGKLKKVCVDWQ